MPFALTEAARWLVLAVGLLMAAGTLTSILRHPHWAIRNWDFPRAQITFVAALSALLYLLLDASINWLDAAFLLIMALTVFWQAWWIYPYTRLSPLWVQKSRKDSTDARLRIITSNVQQENREHDLWLSVVRSKAPDLVLALETDEGWEKALAALDEEYPYRVRHVQSNKYGMMLFSRLRLEDLSVQFLVQPDIPSIHTRVRLRNGKTVDFYGVHPRPPEPIRGEDASARDAELIVLGRKIRQAPQAAIVAGDLNDVAWSQTTDLFLKVSGLCDPRVGRGFYSTFPAHLPWLRAPLDHFFHSDSFRLVDLRLLDRVGSDHLPVLIELSYEPAARVEQPRPDTDAEEDEIAREKVAREFS
jgi:endonuclease/exonuclease/phosphatase (EEP) superfamily protein YafD